MRTAEVGELLDLIEQFSGRHLPTRAAEAWQLVLAGTDAKDAEQAVIDYYSAPELPAQVPHPGLVRKLAAAIKDRRGQSARALERGREQRADPDENPAYQEFKRRLAATAAHLGNLNRPAKADTSTSTLADPEQVAEMERERRRQLDAARLAGVSRAA